MSHTSTTSTHVQERTREVLCGIIESFADQFEALSPTEGRLVGVKAAILIFPEIPDEEAADIIDVVQYRAKSVFVRRGLMLGEFHRYNNASGLRNASFYPLRTPYPALAVRYMVPLPTLACCQPCATMRRGGADTLPLLGHSRFPLTCPS